MRDRAPVTSLSSAAGGFTLLETLFATTLMTVIVGGSLTIAFRSQLLVADEMGRYEIEETGRRILLRLIDELRMADPATVLPIIMTNSPYIVFQKLLGFDANGNPLHSPVTRVEVAPPRNGELANGILEVTEGTAAPIGIAANVLGLRFSRLGGGVAFAVDVGKYDRDGALVQKTFSMTVTHRN